MGVVFFLHASILKLFFCLYFFYLKAEGGDTLVKEDINTRLYIVGISWGCLVIHQNFLYDATGLERDAPPTERTLFMVWLLFLHA
jgi:hypothetical protein